MNALTVLSVLFYGLFAVLFFSQLLVLILLWERAFVWRRKHSRNVDGTITEVRTLSTTPKLTCYRLIVEYTDRSDLIRQAELFTCNQQVAQGKTVLLSVVDTSEMATTKIDAINQYMQEEKRAFNFRVSDVLFHPEAWVKKVEFADKKANAKPFRLV